MAKVISLFLVITTDAFWKIRPERALAIPLGFAVIIIDDASSDEYSIGGEKIGGGRPTG